MKQDTLNLPSDRKFGWTFAGIFTLIALFHPWLFVVAVLLAGVTLYRAHWLAPAKRAWMKFGELLHHVISPLTMGLIFFAVFTPVGIVMRLFGRDAMNRAWDPAAKSYWSERTPPGPADNSFRDMF